METGHCRKIGGQGFALARLKLLDQKVHGLLDELLRGVVALRGALLVGRFAAERRIVAVRRGGGGVAVGVSHDVRLLRSGICRFSALGGLKKDIHFMTGELGAERRCQLPKPARGAEASTAVFMPRGAAQAELTEGAERSLEFAGK